jgi:hypothetical protein
MRFRWFVSPYRVPVQAETRSEQAAEKRSHEMTRYLISFPSGAMDHAKIAAACRCAQEIREFGPDSAVGN